MKKILLLLMALTFISGAQAFAGSCNIPKFIKKGAELKITTANGRRTITVAEIDKKTCWIKGVEGSWVNIAAIGLITPLK